MKQPNRPTGGERSPEAPSDSEHPEQPVDAEQLDSGTEQEPQYRPRIYVVDAASSDRGIQHGLWIDADQLPDELDADIAALLESSPTVGATAWAIRGSRDFAELDLSAVTDTTLIARLAGGVTEHGAAFAAWVQVVGNQSSRLDEFEDVYVGSYESSLAWARALADSLDWHNQLDRGISDPLLRPYVVIDYDAILRDSVMNWVVVDGIDGKVHVFAR